MNSEIEANSEPLPGYRLIKHLGSGGYGEVWSAEAPGGLTKAIKFVFGQQHEKRASHELRALERIRGVRHPFLLSLERIEIVNGRLLVVSELAEGSLKDRYDECRREGLPGIPREELIRYLRDAADALDFMITVHALGHLDIKPENLLILADHVKVADFGLVKDVRQSQASLVGGMTPLYAAPEVFRGLPGPQSDEYSLAVLYQEMLTGSLPFSGANAAQLTMQHLNDEPDLSRLPSGDRYAVSRALAKDPAYRYPTCRQLLDALAEASKEQSDFGVRSMEVEFKDANPQAAVRNTPSPSCPTDVFDVDDTDTSTLDASRMLIDLPASPAPLVDLPPLELDGRNDQPIPTFILGIGGVAGRVLLHYRSMLNDQFGSAALPSIQMLLMDTDTRALSEVSRHDGAALSPDETMSLPLQRPQHYREQSQQLLRWLSRRWLYNIPRSLRTEGLRPLGRLALTDHARQAGQRIRRGIMQAIDGDAVAASSQKLGTQFRGDVAQVFVVASISGGTGGGMSLDVGYAVRAILQRLNLAQSTVIGLLLHSTGGDARHCELARVNAFSWLTEFQHFERPDVAYPGDPSCGFPAHDARVKPFDETYLMHFGDHLDGDEFDSAARTVAEYLRLNTITPARSFFDACREEQGAGSGEQNVGGGLRSFGIFRRTASAGSSSDGFAGALGKHVIDRWLGRTAAALAKAAGESPAAQLVRRLRLDTDGIFANSRALLELRLGADAGVFLSSWLAQQGVSAKAGDAQTYTAIDRMFSNANGDADQEAGQLLGESVSAIVGPLQEKLRADVRRWIIFRMDEPQERLTGARAAIAALTQQLQAVDADLKNRERMASKAATGPIAGGAESQAAPARSPLDYLQLRLDHLAARTAGRTTRLLISDAKSLADELTALGREIEQMGRGATATTPVSPPPGEQDKLWKWLQPRLTQLAEEVDQQLTSECLQEQGLWTTIMQGGRRRAQLSAKLGEFSRQAVVRSLGGINVVDDWAGGNAEAASSLRSNLAAATPSLLELGGTRRVLAVLPRDGGFGVAAADVSKTLGVGINAVAGIDNSVTLCVEAAGLPLHDVAVELVQRRRDRVEFAGRVQSRTDIEWTRLVPEVVEAMSNPWAELGQSSEFNEQVIAKTMVI